MPGMAGNADSNNSFSSRGRQQRHDESWVLMLMIVGKHTSTGLMQKTAAVNSAVVKGYRVRARENAVLDRVFALCKILGEHFRMYDDMRKEFASPRAQPSIKPSLFGLAAYHQRALSTMELCDSDMMWRKHLYHYLEASARPKEANCKEYWGGSQQRRFFRVA